MDPINRTIRRISGSNDFQRRYEMMKKEIAANAEIQNFLQANAQLLAPNAADQGMIKLYEFMTRSRKCADCPSLAECKNTMKGYEPKLIIQNGYIDMQYAPCPRQIAAQEQRNTEKLVQSMYVPKDVLNATFDQVDVDNPTRMKALQMAEDIVSQLVSDPEHYKGLYLYGKFGVGKSYLLGAIANELKKQNKASFILYFPEFLKEMKQSLGDQSFAGKVDAVKKSSILMLDDIGAESLSSWARDEVLGTILQYRMAEGLPTFFSSNFDYNGLEHHLTYSQRGEEEPIKAARIMERIKFLSIPVEMKGKNKRNA
ncbi:primosomal protein DnaI [Jeotgalibacillus haloalkalitolerans]|uniref:Primosomal protein DnaI n=1 Tax=Jeotgalibacillus haloalkalitolerans TaxID=3104292 RepID=A0ABU5KMD8_9BACL|nr:primosomal protein DnaI [Jeotgalibacillus sp. HH7-29]MDZ5712432.1 primosomal protein DnaI [Jeotgalibacillus sp. HH7-29]